MWVIIAKKNYSEKTGSFQVNSINIFVQDVTIAKLNRVNANEANYYIISKKFILIIIILFRLNWCNSLVSFVFSEFKLTINYTQEIKKSIKKAIFFSIFNIILRKIKI